MKALDLRSVVVGVLVVSVALAFVPTAFAADPNWDVSGSYVINVEYLGVDYPEDLVLVQSGAGITGGSLNTIPPAAGSAFTIIGGGVDGDEIEFDADHDVSALVVHLEGTIAPDGSMVGTWGDVSPGTRTGTWETTSGHATHINTGVITYPVADGDIEIGAITLMAEYDDGNALNDDIVQWAVREGTCAAGTNTVFGNVDGHSDAYTWDGASFSSEFDTSAFPAGEYCFIFNPKDDAGENDVRETRTFSIARTHGDRDACKKGGWENFSNPTFKNQGECVSYLESNENAGKRD